MDLLWNDVCDAACDREECIFYSPGDDDFDSILWYDLDYLDYAADNRNCPYNRSTDTDDYALCNESAHYAAANDLNIYLDPNVPEDTYDICDLGWIGDNSCDDSCRLDDCGNDGGDCDEGQQCAEDTFCALGYEYWGILIGSRSNINHTEFCSSLWDVTLALLQVNPTEECLYYLEQYDYNADGMLNFREAVPFVQDGSYADFAGNPRGPQLNCSECTGMALYNV